MMPFGSYQLYQIERPKSAAEIRRADEQRGEMSLIFSSAWLYAARPAGALLALAGRRGPGVRSRQTAQFRRAASSPSPAAADHCDQAAARC